MRKLQILKMRRAINMFDKTKGDGAVVTSKFYSPNYKNCHLE